MEEVFIGASQPLTVEDFARVLRRFWSLDETRGEPHVELGIGSRAYVAELDREDVENDPLFFDDVSTLETFRSRLGLNFQLFTLRYTDPALARDMARALATSELAEHPMLLDADGSLLAPAEFVARLDEQPPWDWSVGPV